MRRLMLDKFQTGATLIRALFLLAMAWNILNAWKRHDSNLELLRDILDANASDGKARRPIVFTQFMDFNDGFLSRLRSWLSCLSINPVRILTDTLNFPV